MSKHNLWNLFRSSSYSVVQSVYIVVDSSGNGVCWDIVGDAAYKIFCLALPVDSGGQSAPLATVKSSCML